ncbi:hypothetical protein ACWCQL_21930 [Streptomyces sp. NPDC002073]
MLAVLRCDQRPGHLAGGNGIHRTTMTRWVREVVGLLAARSPRLERTLKKIALAPVRAPVEHGFAHLKNWRVLGKYARTDPKWATALFRALPLLVAEFDRLPAALGGDWVAQARELCQVVERGTHLYLWFIGD